MFNKKTVLSIIALAITGLFAGCTDSSSDSLGKIGGIKAQLAVDTNNDGIADRCASGTYVIYADNDNSEDISDGDTIASSTVQTDCTDFDGNEIYLNDGNYLLTMPDLTCTSSNDNFSDDCELVGEPVPFSVVDSIVTTLPLGFTFFNEGDEDENVLFTIGAVRITLGDVEEQERCGEGADAPICDDDEVCADVDADGDYACYLNCSTMDSDGEGDAAPTANECVATSEACMAIGRNAVDQLATDPAALPVPGTMGTEGNLADTLWLCVPTGT